MAFQVSPGVNISEIDLSTVVPAVSTTSGAISGVFRWGPINERVLVSSEVELARIFGKPKTGFNIETFFAAANFLAYSNQLYVSRVSTGSASNYQTGGGIPATVEYQGVTGAYTLQDQVFGVDVVGGVFEVGGQSQIELTLRTGVAYTFDISDATMDGGTFRFSETADGTHGGGTEYTGGVTTDGTPGQAGAYVLINVDEDTPATLYYYDENNAGRGGSIKVVPAGTGQVFDITKTDTEYSATIVSGGQDYQVGDNVVISGADLGGATPVNDLTLTVDTILDPEGDGVGSIASVTPSGTIDPEIVAPVVQHFVAKYPGAAGNSLRVDVIDTLTFGDLENAPSSRYFDIAPDDQRVHVAVIDTNGEFGTENAALEIYENLSLVEGTQEVDGTNVYLADVLNLRSSYINIPDETAVSSTPIGQLPLQDGSDGFDETDDSTLALLTGDNTGYGLFKSPNEVDVSLILQGKAIGGNSNASLTRFIVQEICESRKDCVAFCSPPSDTVVGRNRDDMVNLITSYMNALAIDSSYGFMDSGYKYQYDKYNDRYVYVPMNGDTAGLCVKTDAQRDPWFSPAGYNRGFIKNVIKLPFNPNQAERDALYKIGVNPIISQPGQGVLLFGDRTMTKKYSAFDRINVRRLFIVLEKAVARASKFTLFEFNDEFTRAQFVNLIEPFLRDVQGRRGIYDFKVVCDATNNTPEIVDRNEFVGDIYVKPARSINYVQLNFVAVRSGVEFEEIVGRQ